MPLSLLCDENLPNAVIASLKEWSFNVAKVRPGATDAEIAARVKEEKRILITFDSDFANIITYPPQNFFGIIRINTHPQFFNIVIKALKNVFAKFKTSKEFRGKLIIAEPTTFRVWDK